MLLTIKDGQGVPSDMDGAVRVIILSGAGDWQAVPQRALTVDLEDSQYAVSPFAYDMRKKETLPERWRQRLQEPKP